MRTRLTAAALAVLATLAASEARSQPLPGTQPWDRPDDPAAEMVRGIGRFLDRELEASVGRRQAKWSRDLSSGEAYARSVAPNRERLMRILGAVGERVNPVEVSYVSGPGSPALVAESPRFEAFAVRWSVYPGVEAEGLLLEPKGPARANLVVMGDSDVSPESLAGLEPGLEPMARTARLLAGSGCRVLVPTLIDRTHEFSGNPAVKMTNQPHREWIYRMAYEAGRHLIGYEVDEVRAAVDWFARPGQPDLPIGVVGHGEGGLIALDAAAVDPRIDAAWVGGHFAPREQVWREPIYRNVWGLLEEFGDAEVASLVAPRGLIIEACRGPEVAGIVPPENNRGGTAASGRLTSPDLEAVRREFTRLLAMTGDGPILIASRQDAPINDGDEARVAFLAKLGLDEDPGSSDGPITRLRPMIDPRARMKRLVGQLVEYTQALIRTSELRRYAYWEKADSSSPERWSETTEPYRRAFWDDLIGRFPPASEPIEPRTKKILDEPGWTGYAVQLGVWPDVVASGVLLLPRDLQPGERRPVVVCQHGLEGRPDPIVDPHPPKKTPYNSYGARLADLGYIVYAPQNPYIGKDEFRLLVRRAHPLRRSLYGVIVRQHERTLEWLASRPEVDPARIAFYGISYGGKAAMRIPAILEGYCLSICSADFNEWAVKCTNLDRRTSYMFTWEYEMYEFGLAERFNYAEMAGLIAPRPFQVERGHRDGVAPDEWVGYEYAKVRRLYDTLGLPDRTEIAYFDGPHEIDGKATFAFLAKHLGWPRGARDRP